VFLTTALLYNKQMYRLIIIFLSVVLLNAVAPLCAYSAESDLSEGYDENTEIRIAGKIIDVLHDRPGPVVIKLQYKAKVYDIITAPPWYLMQEGIVFQVGKDLEILGAKYISNQGTVSIISREIRDPLTGKTYVFRDKTCRPHWGRHRMHRDSMP
jgi:hypothetical protein